MSENLRGLWERMHYQYPKLCAIGYVLNLGGILIDWYLTDQLLGQTIYTLPLTITSAAIFAWVIYNAWGEPQGPYMGVDVNE